MNFDLDLLSNHLYISKKLFRNKIRKYGKFLTGKLLDVGCGKRPFLGYVAADEYIGMDVNKDVQPDVVGKIEEIPFENESFDSAMCNEVLEHIPDPKRGLEELNRVLKSKGKVYITVPMTWYLHYEPDDFYRFTKYSLQDLARKTGFRIVSLERNGGFFTVMSLFTVDFIFYSVIKLLFFIPSGWRDRIATVLLAPLSIIGYLIGRLLDPLDSRHAFGWVALLEKK